MAISGVSLAGLYASSQPLPLFTQQKHNNHHSSSLSDIDAQGSSVASPPSSTGKIGAKLDVSA